MQRNRHINPHKVITHSPSYYPFDILYSCYNTINYLPYVVLHIQWLYIPVYLVIVDIQHYSTSALQVHSALVRYLHSLCRDPLWVQRPHRQGWAPGVLIVKNIPAFTPATMVGLRLTPDPSKPIRCFLQRFQKQDKGILAKLGCSLQQQCCGLRSYGMVSFSAWMEKHWAPICRERHRKRTVNCMFQENRITRVRDGSLRKAVSNCPGPSTPAFGGRLQNWPQIFFPSQQEGS